MKQVLQILDNIHQLKLCSFNAQKAIEARQLESACDAIKRYLEFDLDTIESIYQQTGVLEDETPPTSPVDDGLGLMGPSPVAQLKQSHEILSSLVVEAFDDAVARDNNDDLIKYFKLFPLIGRGHLGLDRFSAYICGLISNNCKLGIKAVVEKGNPSMYVDCLTHLFENVANMMDRQEAMVELHYGPGSLYLVMLRLQREVDIQSSILMSAFEDAQQLDRKMHQIQKAVEDKYKTNESSESVIEPRERDQLLGEMSSICQKIHLFDRFLKVRVAVLGIDIEQARFIEKRVCSR